MVLAGGAAGIKQLRHGLLEARVEQNELFKGAEQQPKRSQGAAKKVAVDSVFAARLWKILAM